jgi:metallo-beta-lactamase family protein
MASSTSTSTASASLSFFGATGTVTGSKYLLVAKGKRILIDCGLFQGFKQLRLRNWAPFPFDVQTLDAVVLTHAHIDHSGCLPLLVKQGYSGPIYCTDATRELCEIMLPDAAHLQEEEAEFANRHSFSKHAPALPLYTLADAKKCLSLFKHVAFDEPLKLAEGLTVQWQRAGHILGSAALTFNIDDRKLVFSGDWWWNQLMAIASTTIPIPLRRFLKFCSRH